PKQEALPLVRRRERVSEAQLLLEAGALDRVHRAERGRCYGPERGYSCPCGVVAVLVLDGDRQRGRRADLLDSHRVEEGVERLAGKGRAVLRAAVAAEEVEAVEHDRGPCGRGWMGAFCASSARRRVARGAGELIV